MQCVVGCRSRSNARSIATTSSKLRQLQFDAIVGLVGDREHPSTTYGVHEIWPREPKLNWKEEKRTNRACLVVATTALGHVWD